jgi:N-formylmaleamate deformylase
VVSNPQHWQSGTVPVSDGHLGWHRTGGNGPALVLSHGLTDNGLCWSRLAAALADEFDVVMLDARGHGVSSRMPYQGASDPGQDLAEAITGLGLTRPIVMGHSVGARATAAFAAAHPDLAAMVILEDPPLLPLFDGSDLLAKRSRFREQVGQTQAMSDRALAELGRRQGAGWHADEFPAWMQSKRQVDPAAWPNFAAPWQQDFAALTAPTLLICGEPELGGMVTPDLAAAAEALNPLISSLKISGAGHNIRRENFAGTLAAVQAFLNQGAQAQDNRETTIGNS